MANPKFALATCVACFLCFIHSSAQNLELSILSIPVELKDNANSVIRFENTHIEMNSQRSMRIHIESAITVFNKYADDNSELVIYYDNRRKIKNVSVVVYDAMGMELEKIRKGDFEDYSASGGSLYSDSRVIYHDYTPTQYPYTIHYSYEIETSNTAFIRSWMPVSSIYQSVQESNYTFSFPSATKTVKKEINFDGYDINFEENSTSYTYHVANVKAIEPEPWDPAFRNVVPIVKFGVNKFNLEGVDGMASNWKEFGKWYSNELLTGTSDLSEATKAKIRTLVGSTTDPMEKAKIVYDYVQNKVRYISIQIGVGGYKPMLASEVDELSYGDCKGLTNYTRALLEAVGVASYCAIIYGGHGIMDIEDDFLSVQGNHMILYLPIDGQDYWLECTSQIAAFADIANFTDNRKALVIKPEGGEIKRTTVYLAEENTQKIDGAYKIDANGNIDANVAIVSVGTQLDARLEAEGSNLKDREKLYKEFWDNINDISLGDIEVLNDKENAQFKESISFSASNYGSITGDRMIFPLNAFNVIPKAPKRMRDRNLPVQVNRGFHDIDQVSIQLPEGYAIEAISENVAIDTEFGSYNLQIDQVDSTTLSFKRSFLLNSGIYPKESYDDFRNFWRKVVKHDKSKIVLIKE